MLFYRFISENLTAYINEHERHAGDEAFDYVRLEDVEAEFGRKETVAEKGFYILPSELFDNVRSRARDDENLNETLARVFTNIEGSAVGSDSENDLKGLFDDLDVNNPKLGPTVAKRNEKLVKLLQKAGLTMIRPHDTRHTAATLLLEAGIPMKVASERLGHSTTSIPPTSTNTWPRTCRRKPPTSSAPCSSASQNRRPRADRGWRSGLFRT